MNINTKSNALVGACMDPDYIKDVYARAAEWQSERLDLFGGPFPKNSCALVLDIMLTDAGVFVAEEEPDFAYRAPASHLVTALELERWTRHPRDVRPRPGWVFVCEDLNSNGKPDHVGLVAGYNNDRIWAVDNRCKVITGLCRPYIRNVGNTIPGYTPVDYWLAPPEGE